MNTTTPTIDRDALRTQIEESAKRADGVRYPIPTSTDATIDAIIARWEQFTGLPHCGEYVKIDGAMHRIAHIYEKYKDGEIEFQPAKNGSFYLATGAGSFSGALEYPVKHTLVHTNWEPAWYWLFYGNSSGAHRGVHFQIPTRVFEVAE